ncbi:hypothetical protein ALQ47_05287 [Pseudomonas cichorii]|nr:hypothetical protein ALQ47_05287 [Pseudomonas cichorii]
MMKNLQRNRLQSKRANRNLRNPHQSRRPTHRLSNDESGRGRTEEPVADQNGSNDTRELGQQGAAHGVPYPLDTHRAEIHRQHVEGGFGAALNRGGSQRGKAVHTLGLHGFDQQRPRRTAGERFDHGGRQRIDEACVPTQPFHQMADTFQTEIQRTGSPQYAYRTQHRHQIGQQVLRNVEPFLGTFDKGLIDLHLAQRTNDHEQHDQAEQGQITEDGRQAGKGRRRQRTQKSHEATEQQRTRNQIGQHHRVPQTQTLHESHRQQPHDGRYAGGQQNRQEYQRRVRCALLGAIHEDRHWQQCQGRGIEHQKQDLRVTGGGLAGIQFLQRAHRLEADGRGGVIQAQGVGSEVEGNQAQCGMARRHFRHQAQKQRPQHLGQPVDNPGLFGNPQKAQPERERAEQQHHHFDRKLGHRKDALDHRGKNTGVAPNQPLPHGRHARNDKKTKPQAIEHRIRPSQDAGMITAGRA